MPMNRSHKHATFLKLWPTWEGDRKALAARLGVSVRTVSQWVRELGQ